MATSNSGPGYKDNPDHKVDLSPLDGTVTVTALGTIVAQSDNAILVEESRYEPVVYVPHRDVNSAYLVENDHSTYCPFKGDARYWNIKVGNDFIGSAVWGYDTPYDEVAELAGHVAFYASKVDSIIIERRTQP